MRQLSLALCALLAACAAEVDPAPVVPDPRPEDGPFPAGDPACADLDILRVAPWPGGGLQLTVAFAHPPADAAPLAMGGLPNATPRLALAPTVTHGGVTALALAPDPDPATHAARVAAALALLDAAPPGDRVLAFLATAPPQLLADAAHARAHARARLAAVPPAAAPPLDAAARASLLATLDRLAGPWSPLPKDLHVIGAPGSRVTPRATLRTVGACGPFPGGVPLTFTHGASRCAFTTPAPDADTRALPCDPAAAAADAWPFPDTVALRFPTAAARARFDALDAAASEEPFDVDVALGPARAVPASAHLRGQSSLGCTRKSLALNLSAPTLRRLAPGAADDEFLLVSLCLDPGYVSQAFASRLLRRLDLFPLDDRFVRVTLDGAPRGVHLLLERPAETLRRDLAAFAGLVRRRFDPEGKPPEVEAPSDPAGAAWALERYRDLVALADATPAEALPGALAAAFDLDGYLRWLALMSALASGDYVDEAYFYLSLEGPAPRWRHHGWDADDLFTPCHHGGRFALSDPHGLTYCLEGDLDRALLRSEALYARYAEALEAVLADLESPGLVASLLGAVRADLAAQLVDDATCAAMVESGARDCATLLALVDARVASLEASVAARAADLRAALAAWRAGP